MRRVNISGGDLSLMDYCTAGPQFASGGFIADSRLPAVINGSQQQWLTRNSEVGELVERRVEPGLRGRRRRAGRRRLPDPPYTTLATTPVSREKPYLFVDAHGQLQRPRARRADATRSGISWADGIDPGPHDAAARLLRRQAVGLGARRSTARSPAGKNLLLTPGVYDIARSIEVKRPRHRRARPRARHAHRRQRRRSRSTSPTCPASSSPGVTIDAGP